MTNKISKQRKHQKKVNKKRGTPVKKQKPLTLSALRHEISLSRKQGTATKTLKKYKNILKSLLDKQTYNELLAD